MWLLHGPHHQYYQIQSQLMKYIYVYVCIYIYIHIYTYMYIYVVLLFSHTSTKFSVKGDIIYAASPDITDVVLIRFVFLKCWFSFSR
jgi:hypothetical protein